MKYSLIAFLTLMVVGMGMWFLFGTDEETMTQQNNPPVAQDENPPATPATSTDKTIATPPATSTEAPSSSGYTLAAIAVHNTVNDCWTAVDGMVYDLTSFIGKHPGGERSISQICGIDGTGAFNRQHGDSEKATMKLEALLLGALSR